MNGGGNGSVALKTVAISVYWISVWQVKMTDREPANALDKEKLIHVLSNYGHC